MTKIYIYPTDTVWGIGGNINDKSCYEEIAKIKKTTIDKPLSILFNSIEMVEEYFDLSTKMLEIIENLYNKEMTFGISKNLFKKSIFSEAFDSSEYLCIRIISTDIIDRIIEENNGPILTTSLNISGQLPIIETDSAKLFWKKHASSHSFYEPLLNVSLSGKSSSIILFSGNSYRVVREGTMIDEITDYLETNLNG